MTDPTPIYSAAQVDQLLDGYYDRDDVDSLLALYDARLDALEHPQPPVIVPPKPTVPQGISVGASNLNQLKGVKVGARRIYNGFGPTRQQNPTLTLANVTQCQQKKWRPALSLGSGNNKAHPGVNNNWPQTHDEFLAMPLDIFLPALKLVAALDGLACWHHEPEDDPGDPASFKRWFGWMSDYYRAKIPGLRIAVCLMAWTANHKGGPGFGAWAPDPSKYEVFAVDGYAHDQNTRAADIFTSGVQFARQNKKRFAIFETGIDQSLNQVPFIQSLDAFVQANKDITEMVTYWPSGTDAVHNNHFNDAGLAAFQAMCGNGHWYVGQAA